MGATPTLSQSAEDLDLEWSQGDRLNFMWWVADVDWSGNYTAQVLDRPGGNVLLTFTVVATYDALSTPVRTHFVMTNVDSSAVRSNGVWLLHDDTNDLTRFTGKARVKT